LSAAGLQAVYHEQVKTRQTLVSMTVCMVCAILANPDELNIKAPVVMFVSRSVFHMAERYRLVTLLHLQMINLVRGTEQPVALGGAPQRSGRTWPHSSQTFTSRPACLSISSSSMAPLGMAPTCLPAMYAMMLRTGPACCCAHMRRRVERSAASAAWLSPHTPEQAAPCMVRRATGRPPARE